jgi:hypothetical protein
MNLYQVEQDEQMKDTGNHLSRTQPDTQEKVKNIKLQLDHLFF